MIQQFAVFGTLAAAAACVVYALYMFTQPDEQQVQPAHRNRSPPRRRNRSPGDPNLRRRHKERRDEVLRQIQNESLECSICHDLIRRRERPWFCRSCVVASHFTCIRGWADTRARDAQQPTCPVCRILIPRPRYTCMCGRSEYPNSNYSCSSTCLDCGLSCHPGPCL